MADLLLDKILSRTDCGGDCWIWTGAKNAHGYASLRIGPKTFRVHRLTYELLVGPIPSDLVLDHLCRVRHCVNPSHLEPVTRQENTRRGVTLNSTKTCCPKGHPYDAANTYVTPTGARDCRNCRRAASRRSEARARARRKAASS